MAQSQAGQSDVAVDVEPAAPGSAPEAAEKGLLKAPAATVTEEKNVSFFLFVMCTCFAKISAFQAACENSTDVFRVLSNCSA